MIAAIVYPIRYAYGFVVLCLVVLYHQTPNKRRNLVGNEAVDHWDVVAAPPVGAAPTTSSFPT